MGSKLILLSLLSFLLFAFASVSVFSFVISPSQIQIPVLQNGGSYSTEIVSDSSLSILHTNCTTVLVELNDNIFTFQVPENATASNESCDVSVHEMERPTVSFTYSLFVRVNSSLRANMTVLYDESQVTVHNQGTGRGSVWIEDDEDVTPCVLEPYSDCSVEPTGATNVCLDADCQFQIFSHIFADRKTSRNVDANDENSSGDGNSGIAGILRQKWYLIAAAILIIVLVCFGLRYFARRNRTFLKDAS